MEDARLKNQTLKRLPWILLALSADVHAQTPEAPAEQEAPADVVDTIPLAPREPEPVAAADEGRESLETIVVTATKRAEDIRELAASVSAIKGEDLEKRGAQGQEEFLKLVSGVTFYNDTINANRITIRGIGADLNTSNTTGVFIGDVPFEDPTLPRVTLDPNPFDLARIEVLKGPQGTLFGGSALNGAIRYVPQEPKLEEWEVKAFVQIEDVSQGDAGPIYGGALNVPLGQTAALRVVAFDRQSPGWIDDTGRGIDDVNEVDQYGGRVMGLWTPGDRWKLSAMAIAQDTQIRDLSVTDNTEGRLSRSNTPQASPVHPRYNLQTLGIQYEFDSFDALSQTSRTSKRFDARIDASRIGNLTPNPPPSVTIVNDNESTSFMQELRLTSNTGFDSDWKWLGGAFYRRVTLNETTDLLASNQSLPIPPAVLEALAGFIPGLGGTITEEGQLNLVRGEADPIVVTERAVFGETTAIFWDAFEATLGLRAFRTQSRSRVLFSGATAANQTLPNLQTIAVKEGRLNEEGINPKLALKYTFNENVALYGAVAKGFRFGGAQVLVGTLTTDAPDFYKSDTVWSYEIGLRTQWLENTLFVDVTPFLVDWKDPQLQQADNTGLGSYFDNVGGSRSQGVEMALRYLTPIRGLQLDFSGAYVDNVTTKPFTTSSGVDTQPGTRWPLTARWQTATTLSYLRPLFGNWVGVGSVIYATLSEAPNTLAYLDTVFGYETVDATLSFSNESILGRPELSLTLNNATDERGIISGVNNPQFPLDHNYIRPRTLVARLAFSF